MLGELKELELWENLLNVGLAIVDKRRPKPGNLRL